jgi:hypothetical protein
VSQDVDAAQDEGQRHGGGGQQQGVVADALRVAHESVAHRDRERAVLQRLARRAAAAAQALELLGQPAAAAVGRRPIGGVVARDEIGFASESAGASEAPMLVTW